MKGVKKDDAAAGKFRVLTEKDPQMTLNVKGQDKILVEMGWTVKAFSGEVDLDGACLMFNKYGRFVETIFWDNLSAEGIRHYGDEAIVTNSEEEEEEESKEEENAAEEEEKEYIEINFSKLNRDITTLVFAINIFSSKTFSCVTNVSYNVFSGDSNEQQCRFRLQGATLRDVRDDNTLILAKLYRTEEQSEWLVRVLNDPHTLPQGQLMDVLIPHMLQKKLVEPVVPTWSKIIIQVVQGRGLAAEDLNGKSDPFMKITAGKGWKRKTKVRKETLTPKWTDAIYELEYDKAHTEIMFEVLDYDRIGKNEFLGRFRVSIPTLPPNKEVARWYRLEDRGRKSEQANGSIFVRLRKVATVAST
jgi:stress response protein SCP2